MQLARVEGHFPVLHCASLLRIIYGVITISFPELRSPWPAVGKWELWEHPFSNNNGNNRILHIRLYCASRSLHLWYLWRMPEMDFSRALVFRPLVKGNEALGTRLASLARARARTHWKHGGIALILSSVNWEMAIAHQRARASLLFFQSLQSTYHKLCVRKDSSDFYCWKSNK